MDRRLSLDVIWDAELRRLMCRADETDFNSYAFALKEALRFEGSARERNRIPIDEDSDLILFKIIHPACNNEIVMVEKRSLGETQWIVADFTLPPRKVKCDGLDAWYSLRPDMPIYDMLRMTLKARIHCTFIEIA